MYSNGQALTHTQTHLFHLQAEFPKFLTLLHPQNERTYEG